MAQDLIANENAIDSQLLTQIPASLDFRQKTALVTYKETGKWSAAAIAADVTIATIFRWRAKVPGFQDFVDVIDQKLTDQLQEVLIGKALNGDFPALQMELRARDREKYDKPQRVEQDTNVTIQVQQFSEPKS